MDTVHSQKKGTIIFGSSACARKIAEELAAAQEPVTLITLDAAGTLELDDAARTGAEVLSDARLCNCRGAIGDFTVKLHKSGEPVTRKAARIIVAEADRRDVRFRLYGLTPSNVVISLSDLMDRLDNARETIPQKGHVAFFAGLAAEGDPVIASDVIAAALRLGKEFAAKTYVLTGNLKVAADGLEAMVHESKAAGTFYVKFSGKMPDVRQGKDGGVVIEFADETTAKRFSIRPDLLVVDECVQPGVMLAHIAQGLRLHTDSAGFAQADNVHRWTCETNRPGVFCAGPARDALPKEVQQSDAATAALLARAVCSPAPENAAKIDDNGCIRCLTCYRLCPYRAIWINERDRVQVMPDACQRCGICAAECPRQAIRIPGLGKNELVGAQATAQEDSLRILAFCCSRSAVSAARLAEKMGFSLPEGVAIVQVPCAGAVSLEHLMAALNSGADGIMVFSCHEGNCHSEGGNRLAGERLQQLTALFSTLGTDSKRLALHSLASNMGVEFALAVEAFSKILKTLGPSKLKKG